MKKRNIVVAILLGLLTCGLYTLYWYVREIDDLAILSEDNSINGIKAILLGLLTCGIYTIYTFYKMGKLEVKSMKKYIGSSEDNSVLYLILSIFGLAIISMCIIQSNINTMIDKKNGNIEG